MSHPRLGGALTTILEVNLDFVSYCNLRCKWCSLDHKKPRKVMSDGLLRRFLDNLEADHRFRSITTLNLFNSGEVLLHPDFVGMLGVIKEYRQRLEKGGLQFPKVSLLTNGMLLGSRIAKAIVEAGVVDLIRFSVDGGSREKLEELRPGTKWTVLERNIREFTRLNQGAIGTGIICIIENERPSDTSWMTEEFRQLLALVDSVEIRHPHDWIGDVEVKGLQKVYHDYCHFLLHSLVLQPNGDVVVCCADLNGKGVIGNLEKEDLFRIYESEKRRRMVRRLLGGQRDQIDLCRNCSGYLGDSYADDLPHLQRLRRESFQLGDLFSRFRRRRTPSLRLHS